MLTDAAYGIIPVIPATQGSPWLYLLVQHQKGHWAFPKGHKDGLETDLETARRELEEETGLTDYQLLTLPGQSTPLTLQESYCFTDPQGNPIAKTVTYYIALLPPQFPPPPIRPQAAEIAAYRWCTYEEALEQISFEESRQLLRQCQIYLQHQVI
ncbi:MAG: NUDIX domain-containing protein [Thermostichus sp. DG_1_6_bins_120]